MAPPTQRSIHHGSFHLIHSDIFQEPGYTQFLNKTTHSHTPSIVFQEKGATEDDMVGWYHHQAVTVATAETAPSLC